PRAVRDDWRRAGQRDAVRGDAHVRAGLQVLEDGLRRRGRVSSVSGHRPGDAAAAQGAEGAGMKTFIVNALLVITALLTVMPLVLILKSVHLVNSYWGVIFPSMATIFGIFLLRQFMLSIPDDLLDAARIDGAGEFRIYWSIVMPLARPVLVTLAIFMFMSAWNDFMWPLIVLTDSARYTLPVAVANLVGEHVQDTELRMASSVL